jgi:hypothetical protein
VFRGGFASDAAEQVAGASLANLAALVEKSLIQLESTDRFGIHELLRQYGIEKLEAIGEAQATHARHSHYFAQLMLRHETALKGPLQLQTMQAIERDFENIRLAWDWSVTHRQAANLHMMLNSLYLFGFLGSCHGEACSRSASHLNNLDTKEIDHEEEISDPDRLSCRHAGNRNLNRSGRLWQGEASINPCGDRSPGDRAVQGCASGRSMVPSRRFLVAHSTMKTSARGWTSIRNRL